MNAAAVAQFCTIFPLNRPSVHVALKLPFARASSDLRKKVIYVELDLLLRDGP